MQSYKKLCAIIAASGAALLTSYRVNAANKLWTGADDGTTLSDTNNWTGGSPGITDQAVFDINNPTTVTTGLSDQITAQNYIFNSLTGPGATTWIVNGTGTLLVGKSSGGSASSQTGQIFSDHNLSTDPLVNILINSNVRFVGGGVGTINMGNGIGGVFELATPLDATGTSNLVLNTGAISGAVIKLDQGMAASNTRFLKMIGTAGNIVLGDSTTWGGGAFSSANVTLTSNTSLGAVGNHDNGFTQLAGGTSLGALMVSNGLNIPEYMFLDQRNASSTAAAQIRSTSGNNTFSGPIELENGGNASGANWVLESAGTGQGDLLQITGSVFSTASEAVKTTPTLVLQGPGKGIISGNITENQFNSVTNVINLQKRDAGTWTLSGTNVYSGVTDIQGGKLLIDGTTTTVGGLTVETGATLGGHGAVVANVAVLPGGSYSPGNSVATQTITGNLVVGGTLAIEYEGVGAGDNIDRTNVSGLLDLSAASLNFTDIGLGAPLDLPAYVFASYGSLSALVGVPTGVPAGYHVDYHYNDGISSNNLALVLPEPSVLSAAALGLVALKRRRR